jgi:hypothetical protein
MNYVEEHLSCIKQMFEALYTDSDDGWQAISLRGHQRTPSNPIVINHNELSRLRASLFDDGRGDCLLI